MQPSLTAAPWEFASQLLRGLLLLAALFCLAGSVGCSTQQPPDPYHHESIERPARPLDEEATMGEKAGRAAVAVLVVGLTLTLIALPLIFLL